MTRPTETKLPAMPRNDEPRLGPAMAALPRKSWQEFVRQLFHQEPGFGNHTRALRAVPELYRGRKDKQGHRQAAYRLMQDPRIQAAIAEEAQNFIRSTGPAAAQMLNRLVLNENHRDHARGIAMVLDRVAPIETKHVIDVRHHRTLDEEALAALETMRQMNMSKEQLISFFGEAGLRRYEGMLADKAKPVIEATAIEVKND
jgi:hypothetical protein